MEQIIHLNGQAFTFQSEAEVETAISLLEESNGIALYKISFRWSEPQTPQKVKFSYTISAKDIHNVWNCERTLPNLKWSPRSAPFPSRLASWMPMQSLYAKDGTNRYAIALSDVKTPVATEARVLYKTAELYIGVTFFDDIVSPIDRYEAVLRIDTRQLPFEQTITETRDWYTSLGYRPSVSPELARLPMYSTWYSYFQDITQEDVLKECKEAKKYGMDTVIVDDGWQTGDSTVVYGYTGDWKPYAPKFPDIAKLSDELHAMGMHIMLWFSVPYVGKFSENYKRFEGKYLCERETSNCYVLDPRYKEVRDFTVQTYVDAVKKWHLDGLKLDFIDRFQSNGEVNEEMDFVSVEDATEALLKEIYTALTAIKPDILIEFRQPYMGPVISTYGNMIRVWDCPDDAVLNKTCSLGLRLTSGSCAVHSDMIEWSKEETPENAAVQLYSVLFSVPQISVRMDSLNQEQKAVLRTYLDFWRAHRFTLLDGKLTLKHPENLYTYAESRLGDEKIAVTFAESVLDALDTNHSYFFNLSHRGT